MMPEDIARTMTGKFEARPDGRQAVLPASTVQNHAAFLSRLPGGSLVCAWFGGTLEGKSDISIHAALLDPDAEAWGEAVRLTDDPDRSEQNPVIFVTPAGEILLFNTAQPAGNQDESRVFMRRLTLEGGRLAAAEARDTGLPPGTFVRAAPYVRDDGAWCLPLFRCNPRPGIRWTGAFDTAAVAVSMDDGESWKVIDVPDSAGSVHMTPVSLGGGEMIALYRRRQADFVHRSESHDGGRSWSAPAPTDVPNNNSSVNAVRLEGSIVAMVCNPVSAAQSDARRASLYDELEEKDGRPEAAEGCNPIWGVERAPLTLCLSGDGGRSFPVRYTIEDSPGTCLTNNSLDGRNKELSYPVLLPRADGGLDFAYTLYRRAIRHVALDAATVAALVARVPDRRT
ncbi:sialidase family protein [Martelella mediterranea]|uniref:Putative neuraminidase (Sialidase) n=1 Tax=Martelella mediterranea DSM 17316 TaxID=1122214 RepID=A0A1U9Z0G0_9HYPH|nr:exo-alpha-sialidase [Martelella mediterranea]AQZ51187.1 putative neuraminidase (sialidase) [Martelella mediterranea DSM 17316]